MKTMGYYLLGIGISVNSAYLTAKMLDKNPDWPITFIAFVLMYIGAILISAADKKEKK